MDISLGEIFDLGIHAKDENGNFKDAIYSYNSPKNGRTYPPNIFIADTVSNDDSLLRFASINKTKVNEATQSMSLVWRNAKLLQNNCKENYDNSWHFNSTFFILNLIDSSNGEVVRKNKFWFYLYTYCIYRLIQQRYI